MASTTVTFRTDDELKRQATEVFESLGMNLSVALNMFMKQAVMKQQFPCSLELGIAKENEITYPKNFWSLFGKGKGLGLDEEPEEIPFSSTGKDLDL